VDKDIQAAKEKSEQLYCDRLIDGLKKGSISELVGYWSAGGGGRFEVKDSGHIIIFNVQDNPVSYSTPHDIKMENGQLFWSRPDPKNGPAKGSIIHVEIKALRCQTWGDTQEISLNFFADDRIRSIGFGRDPDMWIGSGVSTPAQEHVVDHCVVLLFPSLKTKECPLKVYEY